MNYRAYLSIALLLLFLIGSGLLVTNFLGLNTSRTTANHSERRDIDMIEEDLDTDQLEVITLAGGCFWCIEPPFVTLRG